MHPASRRRVKNDRLLRKTQADHAARLAKIAGRDGGNPENRANRGKTPPARKPSRTVSPGRAHAEPERALPEGVEVRTDRPTARDHDELADDGPVEVQKKEFGFHFHSGPTTVDVDDEPQQPATRTVPGRGKVTVVEGAPEEADSPDAAEAPARLETAHADASREWQQ